MKPENDTGKEKMHRSEVHCGPIEKGLIYSSLFMLILVLYLRSDIGFGGGYDDAGVIFGICCYIVMLALGVALFILRLGEGYALEEDCIYYKYRYIVRKTPYKDIKCIIIAYSSYEERITLTPCVVMIGGEQEKILRYCMNENRYKRHVLSMDEIRGELMEDMGWYDEKNFWKMFKKGSCAVKDYGFDWNSGEMDKVLRGFPGDYYVAASVIDRYRKKYDEIVREYGIEERRIHIIDDSVFGVFKWR